MTTPSQLPEQPVPEPTKEAVNSAEPTARRGRRRALIGLFAAVPLVVAGAVTAVAHKTIDLDVDGEQSSVSTFAGSVDSLLSEEDIELGEHDSVGPEPETALQDGDEVVIRSATQIEVEVNGDTRSVWTTALSAEEAVTTVGEAGRDVRLAASRSGQRQELPLPLVIDGEVEVIDGDNSTTVDLNGSTELHEALMQAGVELGKFDRIEVRSGAGDIAQVHVIRGSHEMVIDEEDMPFETTEREDDSLYEGEREVVQDGVEGRRVRAASSVVIDGDETTGEHSDYIVMQEPVEEIIAVGTKERSTPEPAEEDSSDASDSSGSGESSDSSDSSDSGDSGGEDSSDGDSGGADSSGESSSGDVGNGVWAELADCESGGDPTAVNPAGPYYGLYQFSQGTWESLGGSGLPSDASAAEQTERAQALQARSGWGQWPACASQLGLR